MAVAVSFISCDKLCDDVLYLEQLIGACTGGYCVV